MLDRLEVRDFCGANGGICCCHWAGTMVTEPLVTEVDGTPVALIPTFYMDDTNPAGVVAIDIVEDGDGVSLRHRWHSPSEISTEARERFREHTGRLALLEHDGVRYAALVTRAACASPPQPSRARRAATTASSTSSGSRTASSPIAPRSTAPAASTSSRRLNDQRLFVTSCEGMDEGPSHLEAWDLVAPR